MILQARIRFGRKTVVETGPISLDKFGDQDLEVSYTDAAGKEHVCELGVHYGPNLIRIRLEDRTDGITRRWQEKIRSTKDWYRLKQDRQPADAGWTASVRIAQSPST